MVKKSDVWDFLGHAVIGKLLWGCNSNPAFCRDASNHPVIDYFPIAACPQLLHSSLICFSYTWH